ncbi:MAG: Male sterility domain protein, partial [Solirubrobacterales bacterium]|nr:Male sterility domain protein [Solirubrobacterales bacterium]
ARAAGAPRLTAALPGVALPLALKVPGVRSQLLPSLGIPAEVIDYASFTARFDATKTQAELAGSGVELPPLESYAQVLWDYWARELDR